MTKEATSVLTEGTGAPSLGKARREEVSDGSFMSVLHFLPPISSRTGLYPARRLSALPLFVPDTVTKRFYSVQYFRRQKARTVVLASFPSDMGTGGDGSSVFSKQYRVMLVSDLDNTMVSIFGCISFTGFLEGRPLAVSVSFEPWKTPSSFQPISCHL